MDGYKGAHAKIAVPLTSASGKLVEQTIEESEAFEDGVMMFQVKRCNAPR